MFICSTAATSGDDNTTTVQPQATDPMPAGGSTEQPASITQIGVPCTEQPPSTSQIGAVVVADVHQAESEILVEPISQAEGQDVTHILEVIGAGNPPMPADDSMVALSDVPDADTAIQNIQDGHGKRKRRRGVKRERSTDTVKEEPRAPKVGQGVRWQFNRGRSTAWYNGTVKRVGKSQVITSFPDEPDYTTTLKQFLEYQRHGTLVLLS